MDKEERILSQVENLYYTERFNEAVTLLENEIKKNPRQIRILKKLKFFYAFLNKPFKAVNILERIIKLEPSSNHYLELGEYYVNLGYNDKAIKLFEKVTTDRKIKLTNEEKATFHQLLSSLYRVKNGKELVVEFVTKEPFQKGILPVGAPTFDYRGGSIEREIREVENNLKKDKNNQQLLEKYIKLCLANEQLGRAIPKVRRLLKLSPHNTDILFEIADRCWALSQNSILLWDAPIYWYKKILRIDSNNIQAIEALTEIYKEGYEIENDKSAFNNALKYCKRLIRLEKKMGGKRTTGYVKMGEIYCVGNNWKKAEVQFKKACKSTPDWDLPFVRIGEVKEKQDLIEEAKKYFKKALSLNSKSIDALEGLWRYYSKIEKKFMIRVIQKAIKEIQKGGEDLDFIVKFILEEDTGDEKKKWRVISLKNKEERKLTDSELRYFKHVNKFDLCIDLDKGEIIEKRYGIGTNTLTPKQIGILYYMFTHSNKITIDEIKDEIIDASKSGAVDDEDNKYRKRACKLMENLWERLGEKGDSKQRFYIKFKKIYDSTLSPEYYYYFNPDADIWIITPLKEKRKKSFLNY